MAYEELTSAFQNAADNAGADLGVQTGPIQEDFCAIWPKAKPIINAVANVAVMLPIPGISASAGAILKGLVAIGDEVHRGTCR